MQVFFALKILKFNLNDFTERIIEKPHLMVMIDDFLQFLSFVFGDFAFGLGVIFDELRERFFE